MLSSLNLWLGAAAGAALAVALAWGYNTLVDNPSVVRETTKVVEAQARAKTLQAIGEVSDVAERARAMRRYCTSSGMQYDFTTGKCR